MAKIDYALLDELGLGNIPDAEKDKMIVHIMETLRLRLGDKASAELSDEQLDELDRLSNMSTPTAVETWLQANWPGYEPAYESEIAKIKEEVRPQATEIAAKFS